MENTGWSKILISYNPTNHRRGQQRVVGQGRFDKFMIWLREGTQITSLIYL